LAKKGRLSVNTIWKEPMIRFMDENEMLLIPIDVTYSFHNAKTYKYDNKRYLYLENNGNDVLINVDEAGNILRLYRDNLNFDWNDYQDEYSDFYKHTCIDFSTSTEAEFTKFLNETQDKIAELKAQIENNEDIENDDVLDV